MNINRIFSKRRHVRNTSDTSDDPDLLPRDLKRPRPNTTSDETTYGHWEGDEWVWSEPDEEFTARIDEKRQKLQSEDSDLRQKIMSSLRARHNPEYPRAGTELPHLRYTRFICKYSFIYFPFVWFSSMKLGEARELINCGVGSRGITFTPREMESFDSFVYTFMESYIDRRCFILSLQDVHVPNISILAPLSASGETLITEQDLIAQEMVGKKKKRRCWSSIVVNGLTCYLGRKRGSQRNR